MGLTLPGGAAIPAADSRRRRSAHLTGMRIVEMVKEDLRITNILTREAFENAIKVNAAIGGSTNFVVHLLAIAGRVGIDLDLEDFDKLGSDIPLLVNLMPSGKFLMEDFYYAGGLRETNPRARSFSSRSMTNCAEWPAIVYAQSPRASSRRLRWCTSSSCAWWISVPSTGETGPNSSPSPAA